MLTASGDTSDDVLCSTIRYYMANASNNLACCDARRTPPSNVAVQDIILIMVYTRSRIKKQIKAFCQLGDKNRKKVGRHPNQLIRPLAELRRGCTDSCLANSLVGRHVLNDRCASTRLDSCNTAQKVC